MEPLKSRARRLVASALAVAAILLASSCRRLTHAPTPTEAAPSAPVPPLEVEAPAARRGPEAVVVTVDREAIREADVALGVAFHVGHSIDRADAVLELVEARLLDHHAAERGVEVSEEEIDRALAWLVTAHYASSEEALREAAAGAGIPWEDFRAYHGGRIREEKLLRQPALDAMRLDDGSGGPLDRQLRERRARLVGCLRARARVEVEDPDLRLPDNPYAAEGSIAALRIAEPSGLPAAELAALALAAAAGQPLCDAVPAVLTAIERRLLEAGYLEARASIPWPAAPAPSMTVDVGLSPGPLFRVGVVRFDASALPRAKRTLEPELRRRVRAHLRSGDLVQMAAINAAFDALRKLASSSGLEMSLQIHRVADPTRANVRLDLTVLLCARVSRSRGECAG